MTMSNNLRRVMLSALFLSLGIILPFFTMGNQQLGNMLCLMHIPVLLCGLVCSVQGGALVGFLCPLLRFFLVGMPPMPNVIAMSLELACYGAAVGFLYRLLPKKFYNIYISLGIAMLLGRCVWGIATWRIMGLSGELLTWEAFVASEFVICLPAIAIQLIIIPPLLLAARKTGVLNDG